MSHEEIIEIINEISNRLGATATDLYPKIVRYGIASNLFGLAIGIIMIIASIYFIKSWYEKAFGESSDDFGDEIIATVICIFSLVFVLIGAVLATVNSYEVFMWLIAPDIQAIKFVMSFA